MNSLNNYEKDKNDILRDAGVSKIKDLYNKDLQDLDKMANEVHNWAITTATIEGGATCFFGFSGLIIDLPVILTMAMRIIHKIGLCYGFESETEDDRLFILGIMQVASANTLEEKTSALTALRAVEVTIAKQTWKKKRSEEQTSELQSH